jgi:hypothetical protein
VSRFPVDNAAAFLFPWEHYAEQGERVFVVVVFFLWLAGIAALVGYGFYLLWEKEKKGSKNRRKSNQQSVTFRARRSDSRDSSCAHVSDISSDRPARHRIATPKQSE